MKGGMAFLGKGGSGGVCYAVNVVPHAVFISQSVSCEGYKEVYKVIMFLRRD